MLNAVWLALGGMAIVFAALVILLLVMVIIKRVFPVKSADKEGKA